jgi:intracellular sulfur oxidation DsrE/DsrF family protein
MIVSSSVKQNTDATTSSIAGVGTWAWRIAAIMAERAGGGAEGIIDVSRAHGARNDTGWRPRMAFPRTAGASALTWLATLLVAVALAASPALSQTAAAPANRVVMQVSDNDPGKWNLALNNARNLQADLGASNVEIEIVAYGPGIGMLKSDSVVGNRIGEALGSGVKVAACENTMRGQKLQKADMLGGISYVGAGVVEIMQRQQQGWAYLRP